MRVMETIGAPAEMRLDLDTELRTALQAVMHEGRAVCQACDGRAGAGRPYEVGAGDLNRPGQALDRLEPQINRLPAQWRP
jgi:hypothetical protein